MGENKGISRPLIKQKANLKQIKGAITSRSILTGNYCGSIRVFGCNLALCAQKSFSAVARKLAAVLGRNKMKNKSICFILIFQLIFIFGNCFNPKHISIHYLNQIPKYDGNEIKIIRDTRPKIDEYLDNPNDYFISGITKNDSIITIRVSKLIELQTSDIKYKNKKVLWSFYTDDSDRPICFIFDLALNLIECKNNFNKTCKKK